ncbi:hypothetical protein E4T66_17725 [Sinimarinibacterium sp. CAU 1509]|uniref:PRTRC system protein C n=1 Tax=Sinimarinibacterium sp. CAU 1509 TaxID=2562283 RepID=UPI0010AC442A|nr:PRTRC system protein C [Sinimarinibacterium sp. CAU 1509]TJY57247.1 hypothetical protein E4T66_17725 [Sinimarinibacterium sp. CAU 1509]
MGTFVRPTRVFMMSSVRLPDPDPAATPEVVRDELLAPNFPHLAFTSIEGPEPSADGLELVYRFVAPPAKTKG